MGWQVVMGFIQFCDCDLHLPVVIGGMAELADSITTLFFKFQYLIAYFLPTGPQPPLDFVCPTRQVDPSLITIT